MRIRKENPVPGRRHVPYNAPGFHGLFVYRGWGQTSQQATVESAPKARPMPIPRSGTAASLGAPTMQRQPGKKGR